MPIAGMYLKVLMPNDDENGNEHLSQKERPVIIDMRIITSDEQLCQLMIAVDQDNYHVEKGLSNIAWQALAQVLNLDKENLLTALGSHECSCEGCSCSSDIVEKTIDDLEEWLQQQGGNDDQETSETSEKSN